MNENNQITLNINGQKVSADAGSTVFQAAKKAGKYIPHLCYDEDMEPYGACRLCIVEIEGYRGMPTSCTTPATDGMVVRTETEDINRVRKATVELLISNHPSDCLSCTSNQRCDLQKVAAYLGINQIRLRREINEIPKDNSNPYFTRDLSKCILCAKCVRACDEIRGVSCIDIAFRGFESFISTFNNRPILESTCETCGECIRRCPTGALYPKFEVLPPTDQVETVCPYCGCGCGIVLGVRNNKVVSVAGNGENPVNKGCLCVKGRFGLDFVNAEDRLTDPLIKKDGTFVKVSWDEALNLISSRIKDTKEKYGADSIAGLSSAKCTNEENYVFQKFMRAAIRTNNVDHCARLCHASTVAGLANAYGSGAMTNSIHELEFANCILVTGSNTTEAHPIIALRIKDAVRKNNAKLIVADPRKIDLTRFAYIHLQHRPGTDVALFNGIMNVIFAEDLLDKQFIESRTENIEEARSVIKQYTPELVEKITGVPAPDIIEAAMTYAKAQNASIVYSMGITQHTTGTDNVLALANLAMLTGNIGRKGTGVNPLRGQNNVQGSCDMGALPNLLPGYQSVSDAAARARFEKRWGVALPDKPGLTVVEIMHRIEEGAIKLLYIMGENPALSDPNINRTRKALENVDFLVVQDVFMTETAEYADVVLPGVTFAEKDGTFTNTERRVQQIKKALTPPGEAREDWEIICEVSKRVGYEMNYSDADEILDEIASLTPIYGGITFRRLTCEGIQWPCPDEEHPGTVFLHEKEFNRGRGKFHPTPFREAAELPDEEYPFLLTTGRYLHQYHTGTLSRRSPGLDLICPAGTFEINPSDAKLLGIEQDDMVEVESRRGYLLAGAKISDGIKDGCIFMAFHFKEAAANLLTNDALDPIAKIPEFKVCAVKLNKPRQP
ncbi:MAG: formate dehydrogenase subunit alpha [Actinobacteria bacterium]|nr:formate dehydrogenase subunit alpha [Actinomycetota bacterium]